MIDITRCNEYKGFEIRILRTNKLFYKIYRNNEFKGTMSSARDARNRIDFLLACGVWK